MNTKTERNNLPLALILSLLVCLGGSIVWGLIYYAGYFASYIALAEVILAGLVYSKFKKLNWLGILWISVFTILFNELSMLAVDVVIIINEYNCSISEAIEVLKIMFNELPELRSAFTKDSWMNIIFTGIGIAIYVVSFNKNKKLSKQQEPAQPTNSMNAEVNKTNQQPTMDVQKEDSTNINQLNTASSNEVNLNDVYNNIIYSFTRIVENYKFDSNKDIFKADLKALREEKISVLNATQKEELKNVIENKIANETNLETKKNLTSLLGLIK